MENPNNNNLWYNKKLRRFAHQNRADMTKAEACLWKYVLGGRRLCGYQFRRQRPILNYIADFMCKELMLIIEVDGMTHQWEEVAENDKIREEALTAMGFTIMRFDDDDVLTAINGVYYQIEDFIIEFEQKSTPNPRQRGTSTATSSSKNTGITPKLIR
ncbi:endonuclease domain-containing protein [Daejeonella sp.]|uniref:endonuclease domain-containing protein n=1 Tax=Daejeonella sp. TaxID=2805397 RepID=UPI0039837E26